LGIVNIIITRGLRNYKYNNLGEVPCATIYSFAKYTVMQGTAAKVKPKIFEPSFSGVEPVPTPPCAAFQK
jgi:hypothetical protein